MPGFPFPVLSSWNSYEVVLGYKKAIDQTNPTSVMSLSLDHPIPSITVDPSHQNPLLNLIKYGYVIRDREMWLIRLLSNFVAKVIFEIRDFTDYFTCWQCNLCAGIREVFR